MSICRHPLGIVEGLRAAVDLKLVALSKGLSKAVLVFQSAFSHCGNEGDVSNSFRGEAEPLCSAVQMLYSFVGPLWFNHSGVERLAMPA